jgi:hypothetical protein
MAREDFQFVRVALPYAAFGEQGHMGFEIPAAMVKDPADPSSGSPEPDARVSEGEPPLSEPQGSGDPSRIPGQNDTIDDLRSQIKSSLGGDGTADTPDGSTAPIPSESEPESIQELGNSIRDNLPSDAEPKSE